MRTSSIHGKLFKKAIAAGMMFLLVSLHGSTADADAWIRRNWSKVQKIAPGTRTRVLLYSDRAPQGKTEVKGRFHSATAGCITVTLKRGHTRTVLKQDVTKVLVYRPVANRYQGWITAGAAGGIVAGAAASDKGHSEPLPAGAMALLVGAAIGAPTAIAFLAAPKWGGVYNVPLKLRDDPEPKPPPPVTKQSSTTLRSGLLLLEDKVFGPELRWSQTRRPLLREKLLLDLSIPPSINSVPLWQDLSIAEERAKLRNRPRGYSGNM
ncbi:MAG: hypothetical protein F4X19_04710 [Acidobacteria bacterium]|nr:hypothetical protein [Acidobacteriota bacterium]